MNFVKKNYKLIIGTIIGIILISGISVYATSQYLASQVTYRDGKTVEEALNELYNKGNADINKDNIYFSENYGSNTASKTTSLNLTKGKYIVFISFGQSWLMETIPSNYNTTIDESDLIEISSQSNNCNIVALKGFKRAQSGSKEGSIYTIDRLCTRTYYIDVKEDSDTITHNYTGSNQDTVPVIINMYAIKL